MTDFEAHLLATQNPPNIRRAQVLLSSLGVLARAALPPDSETARCFAKVQTDLEHGPETLLRPDAFRGTARTLKKLTELVPLHRDLFLRILEVLGYTNYANAIRYT